MSKELLHMLNKFSVKHDKKIRDICSPLMTYLGIPYFFYFFLEENGGYGFLTNDSPYTEFYFATGLHRTVPYYAHPSFFRSGYSFVSCAFGKDYERNIRSPHSRDHLFLMLEATAKKIEGFCYYDKSLSIMNLPNYLNNLDLLIKFNAYFKRKTKNLIKEVQDNPFNMLGERGNSFLEINESLPLSNHNIKVKKLLKEIYGLSPQEQRCLELFQKGHSAQATAALMRLSRRTIETYFNIIKEKLNCNSKWDLLNL